MWYESSEVTEAVVIVTADVDHRGRTLVRGFGHRQSEALAQIHHEMTWPWRLMTPSTKWANLGRR
jgi:hypothetical protein